MNELRPYIDEVRVELQNGLWLVFFVNTFSFEFYLSIGITAYKHIRIIINNNKDSNNNNNYRNDQLYF